MTRRLIWSIDARLDVQDFVSFVSTHDPDLADRVADEVETAAAALANYDVGQPGRIHGTHEKSLPRRRLIISYRIERHGDEDVLVVLHVIHSARDWP